MSGLQNGTYKADTGFVLTITSSDPKVSVFEGTYEALGTPHGKFTVPVIGRFYYVGSGLTPLSIAFLAVTRPNDTFPYCVEDAWVGTLDSDNTFKATGVRAWLSNDGKSAMEALGTKIWKK